MVGGSSGRGPSESRPVALWTRLAPGATRLAYLLTGDERGAARIAARSFAALRARRQDLRDEPELEAALFRHVVRLSRRSRRLWHKPPDEGAWVGLLRLPHRRRAALVLSKAFGLTDAAVGEVLGCSAGGAGARVERAHNQLCHGRRVAPKEMEAELARIFAEVKVEAPVDARSTRAAIGKARIAAATFVAGAVAVLGTGLAVGAWWLGGGGPGAELAQDDFAMIPELNGPEEGSELRGAPEWCPPEGEYPKAPSTMAGAAAGAAVRFDIALAKGYERSIESLALVAPWTPDPRTWPHHPDAGTLDVLQTASAAGDPDLVDSCGADVAEVTWKVVVRSAGREERDIVAFYLVRAGLAWKIWGAHGDQSA